MTTPFPNVRSLDLASEEPGTGELVSSANAFLDEFRWAKPTGKIWVGEAIPEVLGVFLLELDPGFEDIDRYIWVVVGDVPPAYISSEHARSPKEALEGYVAEMRAWVRAVENGEPVDHLIPVNGAATKANAVALKSRLEFIAARILTGELAKGSQPS